MGQLQSTSIAADDGPPFSGPIAEAISCFVRGAVKGVEYYCAKNPGDITLSEITDSGLSGGVVALGAKGGQIFANKHALETDGGQTIGSKVSEDAKVIQRGASAIGGGLAGVLYQIIKNLLCERRLKKEDFFEMMVHHAAADHDSQVNSEKLWDFMCSEGIIIDGKVAMIQLPPQLVFPPHLECYKKAIRYVIELMPVYCITKGVAKAASRGAIIGKDIADEDIDKVEKIIHRIGKDRSRKVLQQIAWGGTLEIKIFCNIYNARVIVHHSDGEMKVFDPRLPSAETKQLFHLSYDQEHYKPAHKDGKILSTYYSETDGNCLYNSLAFHMVEDPKEMDAKVCDIKMKIGGTLATISECMYDIKMDDLQRGGDDLGAGDPAKLPTFKLTMGDQVEIFAHFAEEHSELRQKVKSALKELQSMPIKKIRQMRDQARTQKPAAPTKKGFRGPNYIHALTKNLVGLLSVDVYPLESSDYLRGEVRLLFDIEKQKYYTTIFDHIYANVIWPCGVRVISNESLTSLRQADKHIDKAIERLKNLQKVKHLIELRQEGISLVSDKQGKVIKVLLVTGSDYIKDISFTFKDNFALLYDPQQ